MIKIKSLSLKNFLSVGAVSQSIVLDRSDLTLILGENLDLGGDGARNGVGKTAMIQALSYALFGQALSSIKKDNLINRTNSKNMVVTVDFSVHAVNYRIIRGRKPNILKFFINEREQETNDAQGENKETQEAIEHIIGMTPDMFRQIIALNTYNEPFLAMKVSDQRTIIEQLLGITLLSEKAEAIKNLIKTSKDNIQQESFRLKGIETANTKINEQIESLKKRQKLWNAKHNEDLQKLVTEYDELEAIDIEIELEKHRKLNVYNEKFKQLEQYNALIARQTAWKEKLNKDIADLEKELSTLETINIEDELLAHKNVAIYTEAVRLHADQVKSLKRYQSDLEREKKNWAKLDSEVKTLQAHTCYACGQAFHDESHANVLEKKVTALEESVKHISSVEEQILQVENNPVVVPEKPTTFYQTEADAVRHSSEIERIRNQIKEKTNESDPYAEQIQENHVELPEKPAKTHYDSESDAIKHSGRVSSILEQITKLHSSIDPYVDQIKEMEESALQVVDYSIINDLHRVMQHQEYLLDLLTNKKSFVRKRIIEQNLSYLNSRLTHYLDKIGLPHQVVFQNDLSVEISELGRDMDFHNLSRGEMNRVVLALSFSFRDVWESLYMPINVLFIDELIDSGMDTIGVENSLALLKDMARRRSKSVWLVSHRDELTNRVGNILKVVKEGGFTSYSSSTEIVE